MNYLKYLFTQATGYWLHKQKNLPVGADLFVDITQKIKYPSLSVIFDVGANTGQTRKWLRFHQPESLIYCFEPVSIAFQKLSESVRADTKAHVFHTAFGNEKGVKKIRLFDGDLNVLNSLNPEAMNTDRNAKEEEIHINTIDDFCHSNQISRIDLLKIDTEGFELEVLKGADAMLGKNAVSFIFCETGFQKQNKRNTYFPQLTEYLAPKGYYFFGLYQMDYHDWKRGNNLGNALFVHSSVFP